MLVAEPSPLRQNLAKLYQRQTSTFTLATGREFGQAHLGPIQVVKVGTAR